MAGLRDPVALARRRRRGGGRGGQRTRPRCRSPSRTSPRWRNSWRQPVAQAVRPRLHPPACLAIAEASKVTWATWLLHHYLFFRIPLMRPDRLLSRLLPWCAGWPGGASAWPPWRRCWLVWCWWASQWDRFATAFVDHVSMSGLAEFGLALALAKLMHELGPCADRQRLGCRVPTMGLAFLVMCRCCTPTSTTPGPCPPARAPAVGGAGVAVRTEPGSVGDAGLGRAAGGRRCARSPSPWPPRPGCRRCDQPVAVHALRRLFPAVDGSTCPTSTRGLRPGPLAVARDAVSIGEPVARAFPAGQGPRAA